MSAYRTAGAAGTTELGNAATAPASSPSDRFSLVWLMASLLNQPRVSWLTEHRRHEPVEALVTERPLALPPRMRTETVVRSLEYRLRQESTGTSWEVLAEGHTIAKGHEATAVRARAAAMLAGLREMEARGWLTVD